MRSGAALAIVAALSLGSTSAFAKNIGTGSNDNGGNGEGTLLIYSSLSDAQSGTQSTVALTAGQTYYIVLTNPGGSTNETNLKNVPSTLEFDFYNPVQNFQGNPKNASGVPINFTVAGTEDGTSSPYIYSVKVPNSTAAGDYTIATFGANSQPQSNGNSGEDEFFFSTDPAIDGGNISIQTLPQNQLPEVPLAAVFPAGLAVIGTLVWRKKRAR